jgi:hypothetical protein
VHERHKYEIRPTVERLCPGLTADQADGLRVCDAPLAHTGHYPDTGYGQGLWCPGRSTDLADAQEERREYWQRAPHDLAAPFQVLGNGDGVTLHGMVLRTDPGSATIRLDGGEVIVLPAGTPVKVSPRKTPAQRAYEAAPDRSGRAPWGELDDDVQGEWEAIALAAQARPDVP